MGQRICPPWHSLGCLYQMCCLLSSNVLSPCFHPEWLNSHQSRSYKCLRKSCATNSTQPSSALHGICQHSAQTSMHDTSCVVYLLKLGARRKYAPVRCLRRSWRRSRDVSTRIEGEPCWLQDLLPKLGHTSDLRVCSSRARGPLAPNTTLATRSRTRKPCIAKR